IAEIEREVEEPAHPKVMEDLVHCTLVEAHADRIPCARVDGRIERTCGIRRDAVDRTLRRPIMRRGAHEAEARPKPEKRALGCDAPRIKRCPKAERHTPAIVDLRDGELRGERRDVEVLEERIEDLVEIILEEAFQHLLEFPSHKVLDRASEDTANYA